MDQLKLNDPVADNGTAPLLEGSMQGETVERRCPVFRRVMREQSLHSCC